MAKSGEKLLKINIAQVDRSIFAGDVVFMTLPGSEGEMTLMANHMPLISALKSGTITIKTAEGIIRQFPVKSGLLEVNNNYATVLL